MRETIRARLGWGLVTVGTVLLLAWAGATADGGLFQWRLAGRLASLGRPSAEEGLLERAQATRREAAASGLVGRLEIPRVGLSVYVVEGISGSALRRGVGHVPGTPYPGERGNVGIAGHRDTHFRKLRDVGPGDAVRLTTPDGIFDYQVDSTLIVGSERADLLRPARRVGLTLVTCYPFYYVGPAPRRFVVLARPAGDRAAGTPCAAKSRDRAPRPARAEAL